MIITKKAIPRRTVLRGIGTALALPLLDGMVPAATRLSATQAKPKRRLGVVYLPNGVVIRNWTPAETGAAFEFTPILKPLEPFRDQLLVLTGLTQNPSREPLSAAVHGRGSTKFLTGTIPQPAGQAGDFQANVSLDQLVAKALGGETQLASLELGLESGDVGAGTCDAGYSCSFTHAIAWRGPTTPLLTEHNPRAVFERLFGDNDSTDVRARLARMRENRSILDFVTDEVADLQRALGAADRTKLAEYFDAVRDVEHRIANAEAHTALALPVFNQPVGVPPIFAEHAQLMFDLQVLAYQSDLTRVITFMMGREYSGRTYPEIGAPGAHHPLSHERGAESQAQLTRINTHHATQFAYYLDRLRSTPDGDGSLLDHLLIYYAAGMSDGNHSPDNLPVVIAGGGAGQIKGGRHLSFPSNTPLANLHVAVLQKLGLSIEQIHDSSEALAL